MPSLPPKLLLLMDNDLTAICHFLCFNLGLQQAKSLHCSSRATKINSRRFLEDDMGTSCGSYCDDN